MSVTLKEEFESQADWRRQKAAEYPDDERNAEAAAIFDRLAATAQAVPRNLSARYESMDTLEDLERWSQMLREVGFHRYPETAEEFVRDFIDQSFERLAGDLKEVSAALH